MIRPFGFDPVLGVKETFVYDETSGEFRIVTEQMFDPAHLAEQYKNAPERFGNDDPAGMVKVASIPMNVYAELRRKGIAQDSKAFLKWLDRPENRIFRVRPGHLS